MSEATPYFAYGSNLLTRRLQRRVPSARGLASAWLEGHELCFHKAGMDGSAKCNAPAAPANDGVWGALFAIDPAHRIHLDRAEGVGRGYRRARISVSTAAGETVVAFTYLATAIDDELRPFDWYLAHVLAGMREWGFPDHYVRRYGETVTVTDHDRERSLRQWSLHDAFPDRCAPSS